MRTMIYFQIQAWYEALNPAAPSFPNKMGNSAGIKLFSIAGKYLHDDIRDDVRKQNH